MNTTPTRRPTKRNPHRLYAHAWTGAAALAAVAYTVLETAGGRYF